MQGTKADLFKTTVLDFCCQNMNVGDLVLSIDIEYLWVEVFSI